MKKLSSFLLLLTLFSLVFSHDSALASANDFYFSSATFDYYLEKTADSSSSMSVKETLTAVFPGFDQNHGIERCIPTKYREVKSLDESSVSVLRNGVAEPFTSSLNEKGEICLRIGSASTYVHETQVYEISYALENVILLPDDSTNQELYWDTNGTGWEQTFEQITANVHLPPSLSSAYLDSPSCYVGYYGTSGISATSRCKISSTNTSDPSENTENGSVSEKLITFTATNVRPGETLTFDLEFSPDTFYVKTPDYTVRNIFYTLFGIVGVLPVIFGVVQVKKSFNEVKEKRAIAKEKIVPVQYTPPKDLTVGESAELSLNVIEPSEVATLLELAVRHHISLERGEKKTFGGYKWKIHVLDIEKISRAEEDILKILNGGDSVKNGDVIEVKRRSATSRMIHLGNDYREENKTTLALKAMFEPTKDRNGLKSVKTSLSLIIVAFFIMIALFVASDFIPELFRSVDGIETVFNVIPFVFFFNIFGLIIILSIEGSLKQYRDRTILGLQTSKYLDGLKTYMAMSEKERLAFLQSVSGADTSSAGIVKLYEKLLPYAVIFRLEDSWLKELNHYYETESVDRPNWLVGAAIINSSDFRTFKTYTASAISQSTSASSSSSGSAGGGGGGFSGGGGGGGGGGGW